MNSWKKNRKTIIKHRTEEEKALETVDETNESPTLYSDETGQLQVQTTGADLQADIYLVIQDEDGTERTIYISPYQRQQE